MSFFYADPRRSFGVQPTSMMIHLPAKPHLAKFCQKRFGASVPVHRDDALGVVCLTYLRDNLHRKTTLADPERYSAKITLNVGSDKYWNRGVCRPTDYAVVGINTFLDKEFKAHVQLYVMQRVFQGAKIVDAVAELRAAFDLLEEELSDETLKKFLQRRGIRRRTRPNRRRRPEEAPADEPLPEL